MFPSAEKGRKRKVMVADPAPNVRTSLWLILKDDYEVLIASDLLSALEIARRENVEIALVGVNFPLFYYRHFFQALREAQPRLPLLLLLEEPLKKIDLPDSDWLNKPFAVQTLREKVRSLLLRKDWAERSRDFKFPLKAEEGVKRWLSSSRIPPAVRERILKICSSPHPISIQGPEGTGKSEVAKALHFLGPFSDRPFLRFFCPGLTLERFGQRLSLWLDSSTGSTGLLTLFLEEVDQLDWDLQGAVLDLWSNHRAYWPGLGDVDIEVKILSSSSRSLARAVEEGRFRGDLYQILEMLTITIPSLAERSDTIPQLVDEILQEQGSGKKFSPEALQLLEEYYWPGNLQELESLVLRSAQLKEGELLSPQDLIFTFTQGEARPGQGAKDRERQVDLHEPTPVEVEESFFDTTVSVLAHEIKNPLVAISTFAHLLPEKYDDPEFRDQFSPLVNLEVKRINEVLENLLEYSRLVAPRLSSNDLNSILEEVLKQKEMLVQGEQRLIRDFQENLPSVLFDKAQLKFVLHRVMDEAISATGAGKVLRLATSSVAQKRAGVQKQFVQLTVEYNQNASARNINLDKHVGSSPETRLEFGNLSLALVLALKVMARNGGEMQVTQLEGARTSIRLLFAVAG